MATCYQKSHGKVSAQSSYTPCSGSAGTQSCCANGDICLGQGVGLCYTPSGRTDFYIGGCTDQNFSDSSKCSGTCSTFSPIQSIHARSLLLPPHPHRQPRRGDGRPVTATGVRRSDRSTTTAHIL